MFRSEGWIAIKQRLNSRIPPAPSVRTKPRLDETLRGAIL